MFELVNKARKNRGGFSLVELIVVVLIIAIIAVALAPQVMKYVGQARTNTSTNTAATLKSAAQAAIAEYQAKDSTLEADSYTVAASNSAITQTTSGANDDATPTLSTLLHENIGTDALDQGYTISIDANGKVTVTHTGA